jgi:hypothetical protein
MRKRSNLLVRQEIGIVCIMEGWIAIVDNIRILQSEGRHVGPETKDKSNAVRGNEGLKRITGRVPGAGVREVLNQIWMRRIICWSLYAM